MYLNREQEVERSIRYFFGILLLAQAIAFVSMVALWVAFPSITLKTLALIGIPVSSVGFVAMLIPSVHNVGGNKTELYSSFFGMKKTSTGHTDYIEYGVGWHIRPFWHTLEKNEDLTKGDENTVTEIGPFTLSTQDEDLKVSLILDLMPDPKLRSVAILQGKDQKARTGAVEKKIGEFFKTNFEFLTRQYYSWELLNEDRLPYQLLNEYLIGPIQAMARANGYIAEDIILGEFDHSEDVSKARSAEAEAAHVSRIADQLLAKNEGRPEDQQITVEQALARAMTMAKQTEGREYFIHAKAGTHFHMGDT